MAKPLMIQDADHQRLERLKKKMRVKTKAQILRNALDALEVRVAREGKIQQWKKATRSALESSRAVNREFQKHSRLKRHS